jgi:ComF family protein
MPIPLRLVPLLAALAPPLCWSCGGPARSHEPLCRPCRAHLRFLSREPVELEGVTVWAPVAYEGPARDLVSGLKYRRAAGLAETLAGQIAASAPAALLTRRAAADSTSVPSPVTAAHTASSPDVPPSLVPVPITRARARRRGFNQAALLAAALARRTGLPLAGCLERRRPTAPQVGRGRQDRLKALPGAFALRPGLPAPERALLVDDVATTGATLAACAAVLREAGCGRVAALTYARTLSR